MKSNHSTTSPTELKKIQRRAIDPCASAGLLLPSRIARK